MVLYEKYGVDVVWNGHVHSYERTWPVDGGAAQQSGAPIYLVTGGGGGGLETPGPYRSFFQNHVRRGHHYVMVHINDGVLELRSYSLEDRLFDHLISQIYSDYSSLESDLLSSQNDVYPASTAKIDYYVTGLEVGKTSGVTTSSGKVHDELRH